MLNIIVVSDDTDETIGANCTLSFQHLTGELDLSSHNLTLLNGTLCTPDNVENTITSFNQGKFILVAYSHGSEEALTSTEALDGYVNLRNAYQFATSLVYTNSCSSGIKLKDALVNSGCYGYVGYTDYVRLPENEEDDMLFIACENKGLIHFLSTDDSLTTSIEVMKKYYRKQYDEFIEQEMYVSAASLLHNLGCLTFHDHGALTRGELQC